MIAAIDYYKALQEQYVNAATQGSKRRIQATLTPEQFREIFIINSEIEILKKGVKKEFIIDETNKSVINYLYNYLSGSDKFTGDFNKGILLAGSIGVGKTLIMNVFCDIIDNLTTKNITRTHAKRIPELLKSKEAGFFDKRPMFIDDLGREPKEVTHFGTQALPLIDLMSIRYDTGAITLATTNFNGAKLTEFYGEAIYDRFIEMFNIIEMKGASKRL